jgi:Holliday junction resolvase RusA-like endonuclease
MENFEFLNVDADNLIKLASDALQGVAFRDDSQIVRLYAEKHVGCLHPRTEVAVSNFEDRNEYDHMYNLRSRKLLTEY